MDTVGKFTGYGYDVAKIGTMLKHIEEVTGCKIEDYGQDHEMSRLVNVTNKNWEFVAIGISAEPCDVHIPCLMHNIERDEWAWSRDILWYEEKKGFCWSHGHYRSEKDARQEFADNIQGLVWYNSEEF